jgi:hypothetical protein
MIPVIDHDLGVLEQAWKILTATLTTILGPNGFNH